MDHEKLFQKRLEEIGLALKEQRKHLGLTQEDMADMGFNLRYYAKIEAGNANLTLHTLYRLSVALNIDMVKLLSFPRKKSKK